MKTRESHVRDFCRCFGNSHVSRGCESTGTRGFGYWRETLNQMLRVSRASGPRAPEPDVAMQGETAVGAVQQRRDAAAALLMRSSYTSLGIRLMLAEDVQDEEYELLYMTSRRSRLMSSIFSLNDIGEAGSVWLFRSRREDIHTLVA